MEQNDDIWKTAFNNQVTPDKAIDSGKVFLECDGAEIFAEGTMSVLVGGAKARKTFALSLLLEQLTATSDMRFESFFNGKILYFDTEMSERRIQMVSRRFTNPDLFTFIPIRQYSILDRYNIIEQGIAKLKPELVVIDGYKELVNDINDQQYATRLTNKLLQWTTEHVCHITGVLHTNPESKKPRGALGTEMMNKCSLTSLVESKGPQSRLTPLYSRDKEFKQIMFNIDDNGNPKMMESYG